MAMGKVGLQTHRWRPIGGSDEAGQKTRLSVARKTMATHSAAIAGLRAP